MTTTRTVGIAVIEWRGHETSHLTSAFFSDWYSSSNCGCILRLTCSFKIFHLYFPNCFLEYLLYLSDSYVLRDRGLLPVKTKYTVVFLLIVLNWAFRDPLFFSYATLKYTLIRIPYHDAATGQHYILSGSVCPAPNHCVKHYK